MPYIPTTKKKKKKMESMCDWFKTKLLKKWLILKRDTTY